MIRENIRIDRVKEGAEEKAQLMIRPCSERNWNYLHILVSRLKELIIHWFHDLPKILHQGPWFKEELIKIAWQKKRLHVLLDLLCKY